MKFYNQLDYDSFVLPKIVVETERKSQAQDAQWSKGIDLGAPNQGAANQEKGEDHEVNVDEESEEE